MVSDKVRKPADEFAVSKSMECDNFSLQCFDTVGWATGRASGL